jgi:quercetin dioxygenase-like cupin family protein
MNSPELDDLVSLVSEALVAEGETTAPGTAAVFRPALKARVMAAVSEPASAGLVRYTVTGAEGEWVETPMAGVTMKVLSLDKARDSAVLLVKGAAGARYPAHHHSKAEECYVISGEVLIHGQLLKAGDFHHAEPDSDHDELYTPTGVEVLLVVSASDYGL